MHNFSTLPYQTTISQSTKYPKCRSPHLPITKQPHYTRAKKNYTPAEPDPSPFARPPEKVHRLPDIIIIPIRHQALSTPGIERFSYSQGDSAFPFDNVWNKCPSSLNLCWDLSGEQWVQAWCVHVYKLGAYIQRKKWTLQSFVLHTIMVKLPHRNSNSAEKKNSFYFLHFYFLR